LIKARDTAVHFYSDFESPVPYPAGGLWSPQRVMFGAHAAVRTLRDIYSAVDTDATEHLHELRRQQAGTLRLLSAIM
jgi:hypothetical protein